MEDEKKEKRIEWLKQQGRGLRETGRLFWGQCYFPALLCCFFVEACSRHSVWSAFLFLLKDPFVFLYNALLIAATLSVSLLFRRRNFVRVVVMILWVGIGMTDAIVLLFRTTPFTAVDLLMIKNAVMILRRYMNLLEIIALGLLLVLVVAMLPVLWKKMKKTEEKINYLLRVPFLIVVVACCLLLTQLGVKTKLLDRNFGNLAVAFHENGLAYCFANSLLNTGIEKPDSYSQETVDSILEEVMEELSYENELPQTQEEETIAEKRETPNLIFLQLESFFDPKHIKGISFTEDPVPFFTSLKENYSSGYLSVPAIGAGTANTEFEMITGMNLDFFGPGEYPYKTILKTHTCESMAYSLRKAGYQATAMHNNDGTFYARNEVFSNLGFDRFVSLEYMNHVEKTPLDWAKDKVLTSEILRVLSKTQEKDYIYAISVQGHGAYPDEEIYEDTAIYPDVEVYQNARLDVLLPEELEEEYYKYVYYLNQIHEMDEFLKELTLALGAYQEKVVLVLYGDHLPSLSLENNLLENGDVFQTEYVIWSNFALEKENRDLQAYQLAAYVEERVLMQEGLMMKYHQTMWDKEDYLENMQVLMYDMLYGEMEAFGGINPYEPTELIMGIDPVCIMEVFEKEHITEKEEEILYVRGEHFTEWSVLTFDGREAETIFVDESLLATREAPEEWDCVTVRQQGKDHVTLSESEPWQSNFPVD